ncbi:hypothetical protein DNTS_015260 [Danionella cerebrum]|uniref:G-protein coupled receptors family 2 profile 2 domain-containing protein n=1 Tax=Danionella cerebrum TaxID=2873325 RepID=A0A553MSJ7_9TELE|nr:hypothetical protein DNTS_015260 [Danionella translucida]
MRLSVGLDPQGYGNPDFCWLSVNDSLIWSITGPISIVVLINIVVIVLAAKASCGRRQQTEKSGAISALRAAFLLLLLISATWLLGLMAVNSDVLSFHYLFAILSCLQRSLNGDLYTEGGGLYRTTIGESTVSMDSSVKSAKSPCSGYLASSIREKKHSISSNGGNIGRGEKDSSLFFQKKSEDEPSSSRTKWNNERSPVHSTPKVDGMSGYGKPLREKPISVGESDDMGRSGKLRVETKVNVELHQGNKLNQNGDLSPSEGPPSQPNSNQLPRRGILKNKITYPPPLTDKNLKNRLREKLIDYSPSHIPCMGPSVSSPEGNSIFINPPPASPPPARNGLTLALTTSAVTKPDEHIDSDGSNETSI